MTRSEVLNVINLNMLNVCLRFLRNDIIRLRDGLMDEREVVDNFILSKRYYQ